MQVKLINIVDKEAKENSDFIPSDGLCYLLEFENEKILFDTGDQEIVLMNNMHELNIDPKSIDKVVLSHGHWDHTFGIKALMNARGDAPILEIIAHPHAFKKRRIVQTRLRIMAFIFRRWYNLGFPKLDNKTKEELNFTSVIEPYEINSFLTTTGEISEWKERHSKIDKLEIKLDNKYVKDELLDDLSLILKTKEGIVLILGCGHAGVLNICARAKELYPDQKILKIIGGTHLVALKEDKDLEYVAKKLESEYDKPMLYFSHCTGKKAIKFMINYFGEEIAQSFKVGDSFTFEC